MCWGLFKAWSLHFTSGSYFPDFSKSPVLFTCSHAVLLLPHSDFSHPTAKKCESQSRLFSLTAPCSLTAPLLLSAPSLLSLCSSLPAPSLLPHCSSLPALCSLTAPSLLLPPSP